MKEAMRQAAKWLILACLFTGVSIIGTFMVIPYILWIGGLILLAGAILTLVAGIKIGTLLKPTR